MTVKCENDGCDTETRSLAISKKIFNKGPFLGFKTFVLVVLAIILIMGDYRWHYAAKVRSILSVLTIPVQYLVNWPAQTLNSIAVNFTSHDNLVNDNARLRAQQLLLQARIHRLLNLERENNNLKILLHAKGRVRGKVQVAEMLAISLQPHEQQIAINAGRNDGVYVGQPVLDAHGVLGQVIWAGNNNSRVLLITDNRSAVPVQDNRSGVRAIVSGLGYSGKLRVLYVPDTADVKQGDLMVASGMGMRFPVGYPVGIVTAAKHVSGEQFTQIFLKPLAHLDQERQVLLVWPSKSQYAALIKQQLVVTKT